MLAILSAIVLLAADLPVVEVDRDNFEIRASARVVIAADFIADEDGNGVIHIIGNDLVVDFTGAHLRGAPAGTAPDQYAGIGVRITGRNNTVGGGRFSGFKVAMFAEDADGLVIEDVDVSDSFRQRLRSTAEAERHADLLLPHENDDREWMDRYGAGVSIESSENVTVRRVRARDVQNGILLSNVNDSRIYDNDCSFLSGWGLALWRSNRNAITRNAFDFCVRGRHYGTSHHDQGSGGILLVEQSSENLIAENSATHGGHGLYAFSGPEAFGLINPREDAQWYERRGNIGNIILGNDFSSSASHGIKLTGGFDSQIVRNRISGNAVSGIRADFSSGMHIVLNEIVSNGTSPTATDQGGAVIEHGREVRIQENRFRRNPVGVRLQASDDHPLLAAPWVKANHSGSVENIILYNDFFQEIIVAVIRDTHRMRYGRNAYYHVASFFQPDEASLETMARAQREPRIVRTYWDDLTIHGASSPVGAREYLRGREHIVMTEWGPYDWSTPALHLVEREPARHVYRVLGEGPIHLVKTVCRTRQRQEPGAFVKVDRDDETRTLTVRTEQRDRAVPYLLGVTTAAGEFTAEGALIPAAWTVVAFPWHTDPRENIDEWRREGGIIREAAGVMFESPHLSFEYGYGGPSQLPEAPGFVMGAGLPTDHFGTIAETKLTFPPGAWRIRAAFKDGVRVWLDDELVIDEWRAQPRTERNHEFTVHETRDIAIRVEHFELDGRALLRLDFEMID